MINWLTKKVSAFIKIQHVEVIPVVVNQSEIQSLLVINSTATKNLADKYFAEGRLNEAAALYRNAIYINPTFAEAYNNLSNVLCEMDMYDEAEQSLKQAILLKPELANPYYNLGSLHLKRGKPQDAIVSLSIALGLKKDVEIIYRDLCYAFFQTGQYEKAKNIITQGLLINPEFSDFHSSLGNLHYHENEFEQAINCYRKALLIQPNFPEVYLNLGKIFREQGKLDESINCYRKVLELKPDHWNAMAMTLHQLQHMCEWEKLDDIIKEVRLALLEIPAIVKNMFPPFAFMAIPGVTAEDQKRCAEVWVQNELKDLASLCDNLSFEFKQKANKKISIAYLSADFRQHPVSYLMAEIFELHDRSRFTITAYSCGPDDHSVIRKRIEAAFDNFVDIQKYSDEDAAKRIYADNIDILVDLTGHTQNNRLGILALHPSSIQVNYLGYPGTIGADFVDYLIADPFVIPYDHQKYYKEKIVYLPNCYLPSDSSRPRLAQPSRTDSGLPESGFVFCCFNQSFKITPEIFDIWCNLLIAVPGSILWLSASNPYADNNLRLEAAKRGVAAERLVMAPKLDRIESHLARLQCADLFLDTIPYNAHTTCSDALWMGLPVITCVGETFPSRVAGSLLTVLGVPELITYNLEDYYHRALNFATDRTKLETIRNKIITNRDSTSLFDSKGFVYELEKVYIQMIEMHTEY